MKRLGQKGEGMVQNLLFILVLAGLGYAGYVYLWPMVAGPEPAAAGTPAAGGAKAGSPAGAAVQGAAAAGEVYGSGR